MKHSCRQVGTKGNENITPSPESPPLKGGETKSSLSPGGHVPSLLSGVVRVRGDKVFSDEKINKIVYQLYGITTFPFML